MQYRRYQSVLKACTASMNFSESDSFSNYNSPKTNEVANRVTIDLFLSLTTMLFPFRLSFNFLSFKLAICSPHYRWRYLSIVKTTFTFIFWELAPLRSLIRL